MGVFGGWKFSCMKYCCDCPPKHTAGLHAWDCRRQDLYVFTAHLSDTAKFSADCPDVVSYCGMSLFVLRFANPILHFVMFSAHVLDGL
jgi:hypothetical protein